jgi:hypothetical protein
MRDTWTTNLGRADSLMEEGRTAVLAVAVRIAEMRLEIDDGMEPEEAIRHAAALYRRAIVLLEWPIPLEEKNAAWMIGQTADAEEVATIRRWIEE